MINISTFKDLTGNKYGKLTVIKQVDDYISPRGSKSRRWLCRCDCGNEVAVIESNLIRTKNAQKSCGCSRKITNGVCVPYILKEKANPNSKTGIRGVTYDKEKGKYKAEIGYKRKNRFLLRSDDINECIVARKAAEDAVRDGIFEDYFYELKGVRL